MGGAVGGTQESSTWQLVSAEAVTFVGGGGGAVSECECECECESE